ncbi:ice-binding family protein [Sulfurimonas sp.]|uniref:ice-binding family protein n=1 Tax=Sulfurimonas sp. TaxID=2022749 RepID=UPI003569FEF5
MKAFKQYSSHILLSMFFVLTIFAVGCGSGESSVTATSIPTTPVDGETDVALNTSFVAYSNKALDASTVNDTTFTVTDGTTAVAGVVTYEDHNTMVFTPTAFIFANTKYTATITTGVLDTNGIALLKSDLVWSFTTGVFTDSVAPTVKSIHPITNGTDVTIDRSISALMSEALKPSTVNTATFKLATTSGAAPVAGTVSYSGNTMTFKSTANLAVSTQYTATITTAVQDLAGNALAVAKVWSFTTSATAVPSAVPSATSGPLSVNLGTAENFVILAKTGISTTGTTAITGDIGLSPAARSYITGFSDTLVGTYATSPLVTGKIYAADMTPPTPSNMTTAVSDMETAYTDAAGRTIPDYTELYAGDVSGKILTPGLYKWGTGVLVTSAGVTISGGATDVWIFQIAGNLTVNNGAIITLTGGALPENIFWQVAGGTGVTLGTTSQFKGVVLAQKGIVVSTGATVNGRLLAQTAVTLDANAVTQP